MNDVSPQTESLDPSLIDRFFSVTRDPANADTESKLRVFRHFMLFSVAVRTIPADSNPVMLAIGLGLAGCFVAGLSRRFARLAAIVAVMLMVIRLTQTFPQTANHEFLELICMLLLASMSLETTSERDLLGESLRWVTVIVFFYTGFQKVLYASYFDAQFLGAQVASDERFAFFFRQILPAAEFARLRSLEGLAVGSGPYRIDSVLAILLSNVTWVLELALPVLLLVKRTRSAAAILSIVFLGAIEFGAREFYFGFLFINLLLLFPTRDWNRRLFPVFVIAYGYMLAVKLGLAPEWFFN